MKFRTRLLTTILVPVMLLLGCQNEPSPVHPQLTLNDTQESAARISVPDGSVVDSAFVWVHATQANSQIVNLHRMTQAWTEDEVTWNNTSGGFATEVAGSFTPGDTGWFAVSVTALVQGWIDNSFENLGILVDQVDSTFPRNIFDSREAASEQPYLKVYYTFNDQSDAESSVAVADAFILENAPDSNAGAESVLYTGWEDDQDMERRSLLLFDINVEPVLSAIGDFVWHDENLDGIQDDGEPGFEGVTVNLFGCTDSLTVLASVITDADGMYLFDSLLPGEYFVQFVAPVDYVFTIVDQGSDDMLDSDADRTTGLTPCLVLDSAVTDLSFDAGLHPPRPNAEIGDFVWLDDNENGIQDEFEMGFADITVNLYSCDTDEMIRSTVTDADGMYLFDSLETAKYYLEFIAPFGYVVSPRDQGGDDEADSDVEEIFWRTDCITAQQDGSDLSWDAGLYAFEGCTYSKGYWKNHAGFGPQDDVLSRLLPVWLGTPDEAKSVAVTDAAIAVDLLHQHTFGHPSNGITKLYAQLLAAKLNIRNRANPANIFDIIEESDSFLADHDYTDWESLDQQDRKMVLYWKEMLDDYNNGHIGPGHCDDCDDDDDDHDHGDN